MRLDPIERPDNLIMRVAYRIVERKFGKVVTPLKVIYARKPLFLMVFALIDLLLNKSVTLPASFRLLFQIYVSMLNGCSFCQDARQALAVQRRIGIEKFQALKEYRVSPLFDERERAALAFAEEFSTNKYVSDKIFAELTKQFTEREIVELVWMNAAENYFNALAVPLGIKMDGLRALAEERAITIDKRPHQEV